MEVELIEVQQFLAQHPPFSLLPEDELRQLPQQLQITYLRRGSHFPPHNDKFYLVRSGALELHNPDQSLNEKLAEGGLFATRCALLKLHKLEGKALEDCLLYMGDCELLHELARRYEPLQDFFTSSLRQRLQKALAVQQQFSSPLQQQKVSELLLRQPVTLASSASLQQAAKLMTEHDISSLLIINAEAQLHGILTDRDLRRRCVAEGLPLEHPVAEIMTGKPHTLKADALVSDALLDMTRLGVHHLPVLRGEELIGMFTATDVVLNQGGNAALLSSHIRRANNLQELVDSSQRIARLHQSLAQSGASAQMIGETLSHLTDAFTRRLLQMAEQQFGPAPVPYVWLAGGSQGRLEQGSHSDQDNALLYDDAATETDKAWFSEVAQFVSDGLNACGYVYCPGEAMATNPKWRQSRSAWNETFRRWIESPEPMALMLSSIFFDLRPVYGATDLYAELQQQVLQLAAKNRIFLAFLTTNALTHKPPLGFFRQFVVVHDGEHNDTLDLKHRGIVPVTDIARVLALDCGTPEVNTLKRLRAAAAAGLLAEEAAGNLEDAYVLIANLRLQHQARQLAEAGDCDNYLDPNALSGLERSHLKEAFRVIQLQQDSLSRRYGADQLR